MPPPSVAVAHTGTRSRVPSAYPEVERVLLLQPACSMIGDATSTALHAALAGLAERQRVTADNIANVNTPGFLAGRVDFESSLRGALAGGETPSINGGTVLRSLEPTNTNGNNVNLDAETLMNVQTNLRYQLATQAVNGTFTSLRTAMRSS